MAKFDMIALKKHHYAGSTRQQGDTYTVPGEDHRRLMKALGNADDAPPPEPAKAAPTVRAYKTAATVAANEEVVPKPRSAYMTRRMRAEEAAAAAPISQPVTGLTSETPKGDADL